MIKAIAIICLLFLAGCGSDAHSTEAMPKGIFVDATTEAWLRDRFGAVQACTGIEAGSYDDLTVIFMPPTFPCPAYPDGCSGEYVPPATLKIGSLGLWPHEVIHYLLDQIGDSDPNHTSEFFGRCG